MMYSLVGRPGRAWIWLRELFSLSDAERKIARLTLTDRIDIRIETQGAIELMREAERTRLLPLRLQLAKRALEKLFVAAAVASLKVHSSNPVDWPGLDEAIRHITELTDLGKHKFAIDYVRGQEISPTPVHRHYVLLANLFASLEKQIDTRTPRDFKIARWTRMGVLGALLACGGWVVSAPTNIARGKSVSASSLCPDVPTPFHGVPQLGGAVDGIRLEVRFAICTNREIRPWIAVDLGAPHTIREVVVYARTDGSWGEGDIPAHIQLSLDNVHFRDVGTRTYPYTNRFPWHLQVPGVTARYVRLAAASDLPQQMFINEIEVYER